MIFNLRNRNHYWMCMENVTGCKFRISQTEDMKFECILNTSSNILKINQHNAF